MVVNFVIIIRVNSYFTRAKIEILLKYKIIHSNIYKKQYILVLKKQVSLRSYIC